MYDHDSDGVKLAELSHLINRISYEKMDYWIKPSFVKRMGVHNSKKTDQLQSHDAMAICIGMVHLRHVILQVPSLLYNSFKCPINLCQTNMMFRRQFMYHAGIWLQLIAGLSGIHPQIG